ncbi:MAG: hypothetical protein IPK53_19510 [bacterium]|nr:hypothetical protein [bacterium]
MRYGRVVLYGPTWRATLTAYFDADYIRARDLQPAALPHTPETAVASGDKVTKQQIGLDQSCRDEAEDRVLFPQSWAAR